MGTMTNLARTIVGSSSVLFDNVGLTTKRLANASLKEIGEPIIENPLLRNEFLNVLYNKFITTEVLNDMFENPLSRLKKSNVGRYGNTIERMIFNPAKAISYTDKEDNILTTVKPDVKVEFIRVERQDKYPVSIPFDALRQAFSNENNFNDFVQGAINSLVNGDSVDEFSLMKKTFNDSVESGFINQIVRDTNSAGFAKQIINATKGFTFPSSNFNAYTNKYGEENSLVTWCKPENICLVMRADVMTDIDVDVLAAAYHLDKVKLSDNIIEVDRFENDKLLGFACDESFVQVRDTLTEMSSFTRADDLSEKTYFHHWQTMTFSLLCNVLSFVSEEIPVTTNEEIPATTNEEETE